MASAVPYQSPLSTLSRGTRHRRPSPSTIASDYVPISSARLSPSRSDSSRPPIDLDDSDDDEAASQAPQLSALARMLLDESPANPKTSPGAPQNQQPHIPSSVSAPYTSFPRKKITWAKSPEVEQTKAPEEPLTGGDGNTSNSSSPSYQTARELVTPAPRPRTRKPFTGGGYYTSSSTGSSGSSTDQNIEDNDHKETGHAAADQGSVLRPSTTTVTVSQSALRWKRSGRGLMPGLAGRPRRGGIRRDSDHQEEEKGDDLSAEKYYASPRQGGEVGTALGSPAEKEPQSSQEAMVLPESPVQAAASVQKYDRNSPTSATRRRTEQPRASLEESHSDSANDGVPAPEDRRSQRRGVSYSTISRRRSLAPPQPVDSEVEPGLLANLPSHQERGDKENMPPPAYKRPSPGSVRANPPPVTSPDRGPKQASLAPTPPQSPPRNILTTRSGNTPLRPAPPPPPPKMSIMNTATASAGAVTAGNQYGNARSRKAPHIVINGRAYRKLDAIGKGGSCKVYKVMAENNRIFAMKKVIFNEEHGEAAILGYKGEIELLKKLEKVDRVIRLFDWEINDQRGVLTLLMECGETDLAKLLQSHYAQEDSKLDMSFTRHYWREMLLCVQSIHTLNIIHSDLKPANFLVVHGQLKLIDFGIANAVQDDTVNVHRECQVGTVNYMSPESLIDVNATSGRAMQNFDGPKLMKLGAPSDVWSLGIILYQMVYGKAPFAHLNSPYHKINAILDTNFAINYPSTGIGGGYVPQSVIYTLQDCLERDKNKRITIDQLLSDNDPLLNPDVSRDAAVVISQETIFQLLQNAANQTHANGMPAEGVFRMWSTDIYGKLKKLEHRELRRT